MKSKTIIVTAFGILLGALGWDRDANGQEPPNLQARVAGLAHNSIPEHSRHCYRIGIIGDYQDQRRLYCPDELMKQLKALGAFSSVFGDPPPENLPNRLRRIWEALEVFSTSTNKDQRSFRDRVAAEFKKSTPPPGGYETLTVKDAQRVEIVKTILGSKEFGSVAATRDFGVDVSDWGEIKRQVEESFTGAENRSGNDPRDVLLLKLGKSFQKPTAPP